MLTPNPNSAATVDAAALGQQSLSLTWRPDGPWLVAKILQIPVYAACTMAMRWMGRYQIEGMKELRREYRELARGDEPLLIVANHLTFIDSAILIWAFGSNAWYALNFSKFSWNLPAGDFFKKKIRYRLFAAMAKGIFVHRDGSKAHKDAVVTHCATLLRAGEVVTIFPEGRRSRSGRFERETLSYGTAKLVTMLNRPTRILCCYLRSDKQTTYSNYPARDSRFRVLTKALMVTPRGSGRDGYQDIMDQVGSTIADLESQYFAKAPQ